MSHSFMSISLRELAFGLCLGLVGFSCSFAVRAMGVRFGIMLLTNEYLLISQFKRYGCNRVTVIGYSYGFSFLFRI